MKKILALLLCLCMVFALSVTASAEDAAIEQITIGTTATIETATNG
jgi:hypothetical protein